MTNTIRLEANCLFSKYGFEDGDILSDIIWDMDIDHTKIMKFELRGHDLSHAVLIKLVEERLLPILPRHIVTDRIITAHNPIRAEPGESSDGLENFYVDIPVEEIIEIENEMLRAK
jgi:hypothetical protein